MKKKIGFGIILLLVGIQLIRTNDAVTAYEASEDFIVQSGAPEDIQNILKTSCYDCHSNFTNIPWYGEIAPVSWYINDHINEGREELNFSVWGTYPLKKKKHKLEECWEEIEKGKMPLEDYLNMHTEAKLSEEDQNKLIEWLKSINLDPPAEKELRLDDGKKWVINPETTSGIENMLALTTIDSSSTTLEVYAEIGKNLNLEMKKIFSECTMKGEAHNQLHLYLIPLVKQFRVLEEAEKIEIAAEQNNKIIAHLNTYNVFFISE
ncbi:MAG: heme-binding domain-containing protein [Vicingaceae bacterium]|nr:heme-binding domain-containing protein [Vicingaceae bacterium]